MTRYERTASGLTVEHSPSGWRVYHEASGKEAVSGLRLRRFAEQARAELLATGTNFTADARTVSANRMQWADVYFRWQARAKRETLDQETWEYYPAHCHYGQFIPSAQWAAAMRAAIADFDPETIDRLLEPRHARQSVRTADARILSIL